MYTDTRTVKLFDSNNKFVDNFDEEIEKILISIHGENYYDTDEELVNTNLINLEEVYQDEELEKTMEFVNDMVLEDAPKISIVEKSKTKVSFKDFIPVLFFMCIAGVIIAAGYYFLNSVDIMSLLK